MSAPHGSTTKLLSRTRLNVGHFLLPLHQVLSMRVLQRRQQRGHLRLHAALQPSARPCEVVEHPHVLHCLEVLLQVLLVSPSGSARWPPKRQLVGGACPSRGTVHTRLATRVSSMLRAAPLRAAEKRRLGAQHNKQQIKTAINSSTLSSAIDQEVPSIVLPFAMPSCCSAVSPCVGMLLPVPLFDYCCCDEVGARCRVWRQGLDLFGEGRGFCGCFQTFEWDVWLVWRG